MFNRTHCDITLHEAFLLIDVEAEMLHHVLLISRLPYSLCPPLALLPTTPPTPEKTTPPSKTM